MIEEVNPKILFVSRGKGWGHSIRDIEITKQIQTINPLIEVIHVSWADGLKAYLKNEYSCIDIGVCYTENEKQNKLLEIIHQVQPSHIISDEDADTIIVSHQIGIPCCYITNFFTDSHKEFEYLSYCDFTIFAEYDDLAYAMSPEILGRNNIFCVGPISRMYHAGSPFFSEKESLQNNVLITLGASRERNARLENIQLIWQISKVYIEDVHFWILGDYKSFFRNKPFASNVTWLSEVKDIREWLPLMDAVISRGGINTLWEMASAGLMSIAIPYSANVNHMESYYAKMMEKRGLAKVMMQSKLSANELTLMIKGCIAPETKTAVRTIFSSKYNQNGIAKAAELILSWMEKEC